MLKKKNNKNLWAVMIVIIALIAIILIMQTQILMMLQDLQASLFGNYDWNSSSNAIPPLIN